MKRFLALVTLLSFLPFAFGFVWIQPSRFVVAGGGGGTIGPISVAANGDDGIIIAPTSGFYSAGEGADGNGYIGNGEGNDNLAFFRFILPSAIPSGATITSATIQLQGTDQFAWVNGTDDLIIRATDSGNAAAPTTLGQRPSYLGGSTSTTTATVTWSNVTWATSGANTSPSFATVIQELVTDNGGLASSAAIVVWVNHNVNQHHYVAVELIEHSGSTPAKLTITWTP